MGIFVGRICRYATFHALLSLHSRSGKAQVLDDMAHMEDGQEITVQLLHFFFFINLLLCLQPSETACKVVFKIYNTPIFAMHVLT